MACAKGTEISGGEIVVLGLLPASQPDAGADAGDVSPDELTKNALAAEPVDR
jgi:hypothetical protein